MRVDATPGELSRADAVILLTDHDAFDRGEIVSHAAYVLDCRRVLSGANVETL
jgi:UDP-N-acetyl-D-glucosamine dehydrogenase